MTMDYAERGAMDIRPRDCRLVQALDRLRATIDVVEAAVGRGVLLDDISVLGSATHTALIELGAYQQRMLDGEGSS